MTEEHDEASLRHILGYIGVVRDALRMQNWDIVLHKEIGDNEDNFAHTWQATQADMLNIVLGPRFFGRPPEAIRNTVIHELVHAQHRDVSILWSECTQNNSAIPEAEANAWDADMTNFMERFVSWVARGLAPTVPLYSTSKRYQTAHLEGLALLGEENT